MISNSSNDWQTVLRRAALGAASGLAGWAAFQLYWKGVDLVHGSDARTLRGETVDLDEDDVAEQMRRERMKATEDTVRDAEGKANSLPEDKPLGGSSYTLNWSYPVVAGAAYSLCRDEDRINPAEGALGGAVLWLLVDEIAAPAVGATSGKAERPFVQHSHRLAGHVLMGAVTALSMSVLSGIFSDTTPQKQSRRDAVVKWLGEIPR